MDPKAAMDLFVQRFYQAIEALDAEYDAVMADAEHAGKVVTFERVHALCEKGHVLQDALYALAVRLNGGQDAPAFAPDLEKREANALFVAKVRRAVAVMEAQAAASTKQ